MSRSGALLSPHAFRTAVLTKDLWQRRQGLWLVQDAGLPVMGAYGHNRMQEFILGGATRTVLGRVRLPVLMSH